MKEETIKLVMHILDARVDHAMGSDRDSYIAWTSARDIFTYALTDNIECLEQFDYLQTLDEIMAN